MSNRNTPRYSRCHDLRVIPRLLPALCAITMVAACAELEDPSAPADRPDGELGTAVSELAWNAQRIQVEGTVQLAGSFFNGFTDSRTIGGPCREGTNHDTIQIWSDYSSVSGASWSSFWLNPGIPQDCTAVITMSVPSGGHWDNFHWRLYTRAYDLAVGTTASQSSTFGGAGPWRAIDGNTDGNWSNNSVTHTNLEASPWWQVDLGVPHNIGTVIVSNRTDCCSDRLSDFDVSAWDGSTWQPIGNIMGPAQPRNVFLTSVFSRFIRVQLRGTNYLSLAEVQVYVP